APTPARPKPRSSRVPGSGTLGVDGVPKRWMEEIPGFQYPSVQLWVIPHARRSPAAMNFAYSALEMNAAWMLSSGAICRSALLMTNAPHGKSGPSGLTTIFTICQSLAKAVKSNCTMNPVAGPLPVLQGGVVEPSLHVNEVNMS